LLLNFFDLLALHFLQVLKFFPIGYSPKFLCDS
jgi:hypothetical protein